MAELRERTGKTCRTAASYFSAKTAATYPPSLTRLSTPVPTSCSVTALHVMRGMEVYKDRLIAYSLGNFATYGWFRLAGETALTMVLEVKLDADGKFVGGKINAATLEGRGIPTLDPSGTSIRTVRNLSTTDFGVNAPRIADDGTITAK